MVHSTWRGVVTLVMVTLKAGTSSTSAVSLGEGFFAPLDPAQPAIAVIRTRHETSRGRNIGDSRTPFGRGLLMLLRQDWALLLRGAQRVAEDVHGAVHLLGGHDEGG